jgi:hypothetical protein
VRLQRKGGYDHARGSAVTLNQAQELDSLNGAEVKSDPSEFEPHDPADDDLLSDLAAKREELRIVIHDLKVSAPPMALLALAASVTIVLLVASLCLIAAPYIQPTFPGALALVAAFLAVMLAFATYAVLRRFAAQRERRRLHRIVAKRAMYLQQLTDELLKDARESEFAVKGAPK